MNIETLFAEWQALQPLSSENQKRLDTKFMLEFNYNSNHIEGNTLTYGQTIALLIHGSTEGSAPMRDYEEMKAHQVALEMVKTEAASIERPLTEAFIRQLHQIMLKENYVVYKNVGGKQIQYTIHAGIYKTRPNTVKTATGEIFEYASPEETPALMTDLVSWYNQEAAKGEMSPIEIASLFHYRYIRIHPFEDGNGRIARLMVNFILSRYGYPMIVVQEADRNGYLGALRQCDANTSTTPSEGAYAVLGQIAPLVKYLEQCLERALQISIRAAKGENVEEEDDIQKRLAILARNAQAQKGDIKRIDKEHILDIYDNFIIPFQEKTRNSLMMFSDFYKDVRVDLYRHDLPTGLYLKMQRYNYELDTISDIKDRNYVLKIELESPSILIPADSKEDIEIPIKFDDEKYEIQMLDRSIVSKYGVLFSDSQQKEWIKTISEEIYSSIEKRVMNAK